MKFFCLLLFSLAVNAKAKTEYRKLSLDKLRTQINELQPIEVQNCALQIQENTLTLIKEWTDSQISLDLNDDSTIIESYDSITKIRTLTYYGSSDATQPTNIFSIDFHNSLLYTLPVSRTKRPFFEKSLVPLRSSLKSVKL